MFRFPNLNLQASNFNNGFEADQAGGETSGFTPIQDPFAWFNQGGREYPGAGIHASNYNTGFEQDQIGGQTGGFIAPGRGAFPLPHTADGRPLNIDISKVNKGFILDQIAGYTPGYLVIPANRLRDFASRIGGHPALANIHLSNFNTGFAQEQYGGTTYS